MRNPLHSASAPTVAASGAGTIIRGPKKENVKKEDASVSAAKATKILPSDGTYVLIDISGMKQTDPQRKKPAMDPS